jgi:hypothetical protein
MQGGLVRSQWTGQATNAHGTESKGILSEALT